MGLIHTRASKDRARAEAGAIREQTLAARQQRLAAADASSEVIPAWQQRTVGGMIQAAMHNRAVRKKARDESGPGAGHGRA